MANLSINDRLDVVDLDAVARLFRDQAGVKPAGRLRLQLLAGGRSNLTFALTDGRTEWVLRRPPLGHVLATAHDMAREARVQQALSVAGFPVPRVLIVSGDPAFYVMDRIAGTVLRTDADLVAVPMDRRRELGEVYLDALAELHSIDPQHVGLSDFGKPEGFARRQVDRWTEQLAASRSRNLPGFDELAERLASWVPENRRGSVVHGDFRLDNMIFDLAARPELAAVLDWEMSTLGDPLTDLGLVWLFWEGWRGIDNPIAGTAGSHEGYLPWSVLATRYRDRTQLDLDDFVWYQAFACFKLAVILEGIHYRHNRGLTVGEGFGRIGEMVQPLVSRGLSLF